MSTTLPAVPEPGSIRLRRDSGLYGYERALHRAGLDPVAGADEAGRGACAGPLVAGAVILGETKARRIEGLRDSKLLTPLARERLYDEITRKAVAWSVVAVPPEECDRLGMHVANLAALRRALLRLDVAPTYVLTDGFSVDGLGVPGLAVWKGDRVAACVAAASIVAKVTRDRIMAARAPDLAGVRVRRPQGLLHAAAPGAARRVRALAHPPPPVRQRASGD